MPTQKTQPTFPPEALAAYEALIATVPGLERKGVSLPYTSHNGHMFSFLTQTGTVALRLPVEAREAFLKRYKTTLVEAHGSVMKEYVIVPARLLRKLVELTPYLEASYAYAKTLKPKKSAPRKKAASKR
jgi:hypothetical protein